ncbi:hypothetical protein SAMN05216388_10472 [Halorientalis persicus]|uniref:Uncharacterized protein n=1 Tax=Halorientalis persicus TaxID=1367881 RepID=A0A1H8W386_9EURY|nr:hypothetical protein SAMN05216388_10472 [Halorientalis persicus]
MPDRTDPTNTLSPETQSDITDALEIVDTGGVLRADSTQRPSLWLIRKDDQYLQVTPAEDRTSIQSPSSTRTILKTYNTLHCWEDPQVAPEAVANAADGRAPGQEGLDTF